LGKARPSQASKKHEADPEKSARDSQKTRHPAAAGDQGLLTETEFLELAATENRVPAAVDESWTAEEEEQGVRPAKKSPWSETLREKEKRRSAFSGP